MLMPREPSSSRSSLTLICSTSSLRQWNRWSGDHTQDGVRGRLRTRRPEFAPLHVVVVVVGGSDTWWAACQEGRAAGRLAHPPVPGGWCCVPIPRTAADLHFSTLPAPPLAHFTRLWRSSADIDGRALSWLTEALVPAWRGVTTPRGICRVDAMPAEDQRQPVRSIRCNM